MNSLACRYFPVVRCGGSSRYNLVDRKTIEAEDPWEPLSALVLKGRVMAPKVYDARIAAI